MIDFEHYRDSLSDRLDEAYGYLSSSKNDVKSALLCVLEALGDVKQLIDEMVENAEPKTEN